MKKKIMGVIVALDDYSGFSQQNKVIFDELSRKFENVYVINVINLKFGKKIENIKYENSFPKNFI